MTRNKKTKHKEIAILTICKLLRIGSIISKAMHSSHISENAYKFINGEVNR